MYRKEGRLISIDGLSGSGKSTIVKLLTHELRAINIPVIPSELTQARKLFDRSRSLEGRYCFFIASTLYSMGLIQEILQTGENVIVESYLYRTIAFHLGMGAKTEIALAPNTRFPDVTFYLECSPVERIRRLGQRSREDEKSYWDELAEENQTRILQEYNRFNMYHVDTSTLTVKQVIYIILDYLNKTHFHKDTT